MVSSRRRQGGARQRSGRAHSAEPVDGPAGGRAIRARARRAARTRRRNAQPHGQ